MAEQKLSDTFSASGPQQLDLKDILRRRGIPLAAPLAALAARIIHEKELNDILRYGYPETGSGFARRIYEYLDITINTEGLDNIPDDRYVFASNHPLGGLDGIGLVKILGEKYGDANIRVLVNDMLMNIKPFGDVFIPINKYGAQGRKAARDIAEAYAGDAQIVMFPAGLVSRLHPDGTVRDLPWQKSFVTKALETGRRIVPVTFRGLNRRRFYRTAKLREKAGLKFNFEQILLPAEVFAARHSRFDVIFHTPVDPVELRANGASTPRIVSTIRQVSEPGAEGFSPPD